MWNKYNTTLIVTDDKNATTKDYVIVKIIAPRFLAKAGVDFNATEDGLFNISNILISTVIKDILIMNLFI